MQVCWVVPDLEAAIGSWARTAGVGPFFWFDGVDCTDGRYRGTPAEFPAVTAAIAYAGELQIELVCQDNDEPGVFRDVFAKWAVGSAPYGVGLHRLRSRTRRLYRRRGRTRLRRPDRQQPHLLGRHHAHAGFHGRVARAEPDARRRIRRDAGRRAIVGRHRPASPGSDVRPDGRRRTGIDVSPLFGEVVAARADHDALIAAGETLTYRELDRRTARMARALLAIGAGKATRIAFLAPDSALPLTTFYAALRIGALVTPISTLTTPSELAHIIRTSDAQILIGVRRFLNRDYATNLEAALAGLGVRTRQSSSVFPPRRICDRSGSMTSPGCHGPRPSTNSWAVPTTPMRRMAHCSRPSEREVVPGDDAFVVYTSGSTAAPKAVVHGQWARCPPAPGSGHLFRCAAH